jgi:hypothetical protein
VGLRQHALAQDTQNWRGGSDGARDGAPNRVLAVYRRQRGDSGDFSPLNIVDHAAIIHFSVATVFIVGLVIVSSK